MFVVLNGKELLRKRVFLVTLLLTVLFIGLYSYGLYSIVHHSQNDDLMQKYLNGIILLLLGLYFAQMISAFFVFFSSMGAISGEIENGLLFAVLARPTARWKIYLGKWIGFAVWNLLYGAILFWAIIFLIHGLAGFPFDVWSVLKAFLLFEWIPLLLLALSQLGSTYLPMIGNGVLCAMLYGMGLFSGFLAGFVDPADPNKISHGVENFSTISSLIMPADAIFRRMTYMFIGNPTMPFSINDSKTIGPFANPVLPSNTFMIYTVVYLLALLVWGCIRFSKKDIS